MRTRYSKIGAAAVLLGATVVGLVAQPAGATTVTTEAQLQTAWANASETSIVLANDVNLTCNGGGDLDRTSSTALTLDGAGFTITQTCANERVMEQSGTATVTLKNVTVTGGHAVGNGGGGIRASGNVVVENSTITGNSAPTTGGGAINANNATVVKSTIAGNSASDFGGAINTTNLTMTASTVSGNTSADRAGGIAAATATLKNSTVSGNKANGSVDGQHGQGGGIYVFSVTLVYSDVVNNTSGGGANIYAEDGVSSFGSVVALPKTGDNCTGGGSTTSHGYNFTDDKTCDFGESTDTSGNPQLGALAANGGPTKTHLPVAASPLVDAIPPAKCQTNGASGITSDQRAITRPQAGACDIGAVELAASTPATTAAPPVTQAGTVPVTVAPQAELPRTGGSGPAVALVGACMLALGAAMVRGRRDRREL